MNTTERFKVWRRRSGLSMRAAAKELGVSLYRIQKIEAGLHSPFCVIDDCDLPVSVSAGEALWLARKGCGMSIPAAAKYLTMRISTLHAIERGYTTLETEEMLLLSDAYDAFRAEKARNDEPCL